MAGSRRLCYCLFSRTKEPAAKLLVLLETGKARILSATVSPEADQWFASLTCEVERQPASPARREGEPVSVDLGLDCFAVLSDGTRIKAPKPLKRALKLLRCRSGQLSRTQKGSKTTLRLRLARLHRRIRNIRRDGRLRRRLTTVLAKTRPAIVVEELSVRGLMGGWQSRSVADAGWGTFRRMLEYKSSWYGSRLIMAPRGFPSTCCCSRCGVPGPKLSLSQRMFRCSGCGFEAG